jgi:VWFA-related protein
MIGENTFLKVCKRFGAITQRLIAAERFPYVVALSLLVPAVTTAVWGQAEPSSPQTQSVSVESKADVRADSPSLTIKARSNLVQVRVVVRDADDKPVAGLKAEDFQIFDENQLQTISTFAVETSESREGKKNPTPRDQPPSVENMLPDRFVALTFDDANLSSRDAVQIKKAAELFLKRPIESDRIGIYSTSGQVTQEFTSDTEALRRALLRVAPRSVVVTNDRQCPNVTYNTARQIEEYHDSAAATAVINETWMCAFAGDPQMFDAARAVAQSAIHQALRTGQAGTYSGFRHLEDIVRHLSQMPGERVLVLLSPGFLHADQPSEEWQIIDLANRANVVVNSIDVRGINVPDGGDDTKLATDLLETRDQRVQERLNAQLEQTSVLASLAYGTGGTFFHNSNDLLGGLGMTASPQVRYVLGFAPHNLKQDGRYHTLKVKLTVPNKYSIQARRGYFAPHKLDAKAEEDRQIEDDLHSRGEAGNLFLDLQAHSFARGKERTQILVTSKLAVSCIRFKEAGGKRSDVLRMITAIFDENGNVVTGGEKHLTMDLNEEQYHQLIQAGLTVNSSFELKPGRYLVRQLIKDTASDETSSRNQSIEIAESLGH